MKGIVFRFLLGGFGGFVGWLLIEWTKPENVQSAEWVMFETRLTAVCGLLIGFLLAGWNGYQQGSRSALLKQAGLGALLGAIAALVGKSIGGIGALIVGGPNWLNPENPIALVAARTMVGLGLGSCLGLGIGISSGSGKKIIRSLIGGSMGGAVGGVLFDPLGGIVANTVGQAIVGQQKETGDFSRALLFTLTGAFIGLFIGAVEAIARTAWIRQTLGRNEGREWVLDKQTTVIGRDERADIPLFGDMYIAPNHATIVRQGDQYWIFDAGSPTGVLVNGARVQSMALPANSMITLGSINLEFLVRKGSTVGRAAEQLRSQGSQPIQAVQPQRIAPVAPVTPTQMPNQTMSPIAPIQAPTVAMAPVTPIQTQANQTVGTTLVARSGPIAGQRFPVNGNLEVGREGSGIAIGFDSNASRRHAMIASTPLGAFVKDLGSTNGTFVNGRQVNESPLTRGDVVRIGSTEFVVE